MPGRRAGQWRVEERVKSDDGTKETGGSQQPSKGRARGRGHSEHTTSTSPQQSTREGGTRGTDEGHHHAPLHAPHRHHEHRTHQHTRPQHVASGPRQTARRAGSRERGGALTQTPPTTPAARSVPGHASNGASAGPPHPHNRSHSTWVVDPDSPPRGRPAVGGGAPDLRRPSQGRRAPPPGTPFCHPRSVQQRLARAHAVGPVLGPHAHTKPHPGHTGSGTPAARPRGRAARGGKSPDTRRPSQGGRPPPRGTAPPAPQRHAAPTGHAS